MSIYETIIQYRWIDNHVTENGLCKVVAWLDRGSQFVNAPAVYFFLAELLYKYVWILSVEVNFFIAKHGKTVVDGHFGLMNYYVTLFCRISERGIYTTDELGNAIVMGHNKAKEIRAHRDSLKRNDNMMDMDEVKQDSDVMCINFDLDVHDPYSGVLKLSK